MRPALFTILPMLAAAVLVMVGGERMSRRSDETRIPADRERLFDFADSFRSETERLDDLYVGHLRALADIAVGSDKKTVISSAEQISGVRLIRLFRKRGDDFAFPVGFQGDLPEIEIEGGKTPLNANEALLVGASLLTEDFPEGGKWMELPDAKFRAYCYRPAGGLLAVILVDLSEIQSLTLAHLVDWVETPLTPLKEAGERTSIEMVSGRVLAGTGEGKRGPASSIVPLRTGTGDWRIMAWDGITTNVSRDAATLAVATTLATLLLVAGFLLFFQQRRALRLASDRVSFVNRVSHELGTPLTNLSLNLDLATESLGSRPIDTRRRLGLVSEEIARLSRLVANVLTFSHKERGTLELRPALCIPEEVVRGVVENFRPALERRGIVIDEDIDALEAVLLDPDALGQIVGNLLSNVEKYASSGKWLSITCRPENERLEVVVRDRGRGVPAAHRDRVFTAFERVGSATNEGSSGTGLGLSIARDLAVKMGGNLELLDEAKGAAFRLDLPAPPALSVVSKTHPAA